MVRRDSVRSVGILLAAVVAVSVGCNRDSSAAEKPMNALSTGPSEAVSAAEGDAVKNFQVTFSAAPCSVGTACKAVVRLEARNGFHVNAEYPHKFTVNEVAGVEFLGKKPEEPRVFSKAGGDFRFEGEGAGTLEVRFKAPSKGNVAIAGPFKFSICTAARCQFETFAVAGSVVAK